MPRFNNKLNKKEKEQYKRTFDTSRIYMAEVMDTRSASKSGDLMVYIIGSSKKKDDSRNWIHASYASNFYGTTPYDANSNPSYEKDPQSFGQWFPMPCVGNFVFVFFPVTSVENISCFWFACPVSPFTNYMLPGIPGAYNDGEHAPLCERNDKCGNSSKNDKNKKTSVNENKVDGNSVEKDDFENAESIQKLIKQYNISQDDLQMVVSYLGNSQGNNSIDTSELNNYLKENTSLKNNSNTEISQSLLDAYKNNTITEDNIEEFYKEIDKLNNVNSNGDDNTSGGCANNIAKQKKLNQNIAESEKHQAKYTPLSEALKRQGLEKDGVRGYSTAGAKRESPSMCYGIKTPLGNSLVIDDGWLDEDKNRKPWKWNALSEEKSDEGDINQIRKLVGKSDGKSPWQRQPNKGLDKRKNAGFRLRTRNGTQILIADEGTIYMVNNDGSCWVEMTKNGFLEGYSKKGVAISSDGDINLHTSKNVFIECEETLALKAKKINIETIADGSDKNKDPVGGDINIKNVAHINTKAVINANAINALEGKINTFESKGGQVIGGFAGVFYGKTKSSEALAMADYEIIKEPKIEPFKIEEPKEEEKVDPDGQGTCESDNKKTKKTINTKVTTHEPYFGHCKTCVKKGSKSEKEQQEEKKKEEEEKKQEEKEQKEQQEQLKSGCNSCNGCNTSTGCCGNSNTPVSSCCGCSGVTSQCNKENLNEVPELPKNTTCPNKKLSEYFTLPQLCNSQTAKANGISNVPENNTIEQNLEALAKNILDPIKKKFGNLQINSGYRSQALNEALENSSSNSQHLYGQAADIEVPNVSNLELAQWIKNNLSFDQVILENATDLDNNVNSGWVHVSYSRTNNRHQALTSKNKITQNGLIG